MGREKTGIRQITIGSSRYNWVVRRLDESHVVLRVWAAERARRDYPLEVQMPFDDPWLNLGPILVTPPERRAAIFQLVPVTPGVVREAIEAAMAAGWTPYHPPHPRLFEKRADGTLVPTDVPAT
jgi:hypothetical protein